jgi:hypothetical protein
MGKRLAIDSGDWTIKGRLKGMIGMPCLGGGGGGAQLLLLPVVVAAVGDRGPRRRVVKSTHSTEIGA